MSVCPNHVCSVYGQDLSTFQREDVVWFGNLKFLPFANNIARRGVGYLDNLNDSQWDRLAATVGFLWQA